MPKELRIEENRIIIDPWTRMNNIEINIPLSDWGLNLAKNRKQKFNILFTLGSMRKEDIDEIIEFLEKDLYGITHFGILDKRKVFKVKLAKSKYLMDVTPPIVIEEMSRGSVINSIDEYNITFKFGLNYDELICLLEFLKIRTHKDLEYFFQTKTKIKKPQQKKEEEVDDK